MVGWSSTLVCKPFPHPNSSRTFFSFSISFRLHLAGAHKKWWSTTVATRASRRTRRHSSRLTWRGAITALPRSWRCFSRSTRKQSQPRQTKATFPGQVDGHKVAPKLCPDWAAGIKPQGQGQIIGVFVFHPPSHKCSVLCQCGIGWFVRVGPDPPPSLGAKQLDGREVLAATVRRPQAQGSAPSARSSGASPAALFAQQPQGRRYQEGQERGVRLKMPSRGIETRRNASSSFGGKWGEAACQATKTNLRASSMGILQGVCRDNNNN